MKKTRLFNAALLLVCVLFVPDSRAQDHTRLSLPESAIARLGKGYIGAGDRAVAYSPDGTRLAVASSIGIWLYDVYGAEVALLTGHRSVVSSVAFSPDGTTLASGSYDETVRLWEVDTGQLKTTLTGHRSVVSSVAFSPDGTTLASGSYDVTIRLWEVDTGQLKTTLTGHKRVVECVAFSPDGTTLASGSNSGSIRLWEVATGQLKTTLRGHTSLVSSVAFSPDGKTLASGAWDTTIRLWDANSGQLKNTFAGHTPGVGSLVFSPDGKTLVSGGADETIHLWDANSGQLENTLIGHTDNIYSVAFSPDGKTLASGSKDETIRLWDANSGQLENTLIGHMNNLYSVSFSVDSTTLASGGGADETIRLWDANSGQLKNTLIGHTEWVWSVVFSPDGKTLASASWDHTVRLWDADSGQLKNTLIGHTEWVLSVAFSPDGKTLASGSTDETIRLWDADSGQLKNTLIGHTEWVYSVAFSPDGKTLASASRDQTIRLWDADSGQLKNTLVGHTEWIFSVAFSPDGKTLASASRDQTIRLWDADSGQLENTLIGHTEWVYSVAFSPDGKTLASGSNDKTIRLWSIPTGHLRATLAGHTAYIFSVVFSSDGKTLASASGDGTILLWDVLNILYPPADISVPLGFAVERWSRSEPVAMDVIANREYGTGIIGATILNAASDDGEVLLWRYSADSEELVARIPAKLVNAVPTVRFDPTGLFDNKLFVAISAGPVGGRTTRVVIVEPNGEFRNAINIYVEGMTPVAIEFSSQPSYPAGAYLYYADSLAGFYRLDESFNLHRIASHTIPSGRSDIDPIDLKFDPTGKYGGLLTLSDTDLNNDELSGLYQLQADGEWQTLVSPAPVSERQFQGIAFSDAGPLGSGLYVADAAANNIWIASPRGHIEAFAIGFAAPKRVAIGPKGTDMWVTDQTGLYRIFSTDPSDRDARKATLPITSSLESNYPNPFNNSTQIPYRVSASGPVRLVIYSVLGQPVRTLVDEVQITGAYQVSWDGRDHLSARVASGVYLYQLQAGPVAHMRKMVLVK